MTRHRGMLACRRYVLALAAVAGLLTVTVFPGSAQAFQTGWWLRVNQPQMLAQFAKEGNTLILGESAIWFTNPGDPTIKTFLDEANKYGMKVILGMSKAEQMPTSNFVNAVNTYKSHPALYGWFIADEPEIYGWYIHDYLAVNPGFYHLLKSNDPNHPAFISFNQPYAGSLWTTNWNRIRQWYDVSDLVAIHAYSSYSTVPEFGTSEARYFYDLWKQMMQDAANYGKAGVIATCQGFGDNTYQPWKTPTYNEIRYAVFSAVVNGVDKVLFWLYDGWGSKDPKAVENVRQMVAQLQSVSPQMENGETNDPAVGVNQTSERLAYRYGVNGSDHILLAVNIYNRMSGGSYLDGVQFTLPLGVDAQTVEVLHENRTIPVVNGKFTDSFAPFEVHIYKFVAGAAPSPPPPPPPVNHPPVASFTYTVSTLMASFDASGSSDPDGNITEYTWNFGDGQSGSGKVASHTYGAAGTYNVVLKVKDNLGATSQVSKSVTVTNPVVSKKRGKKFSTASASANLEKPKLSQTFLGFNP